MCQCLDSLPSWSFFPNVIRFHPVLLFILLALEILCSLIVKVQNRSCEYIFPSSSSFSFEVRWGKDRPQRAEVGCDRPGAEPPQAPSRPTCLPALLGNPWQVWFFSPFYSPPLLPTHTWFFIVYIVIYLAHTHVDFSSLWFIRYMVKHKSHLRFWAQIRVHLWKSHRLILQPSNSARSTFSIQAANPSSNMIPVLLWRRRGGVKVNEWTPHAMCFDALDVRAEIFILIVSSCFQVVKQKYQNVFDRKRLWKQLNNLLSDTRSEGEIFIFVSEETCGFKSKLFRLREAWK